MARMVHAGEDPRFIFRRMIILASEDVGLADPQALPVVMAASQAYDYVGLPEGRFHLAQACLYLCQAPKSNSTMAFFDALKVIEKEKTGDVPDPMKDGNRDGEGFGHGKGYLYPHAFQDHWVAQAYLPKELQGRVFYQPGTLGWEGTRSPELERRRDLQLSALMAQEKGNSAFSLFQDRIHQNRDEILAQLRGDLLPTDALMRDELVLVVEGNGGLLFWEALRRQGLAGVHIWAPAERSDLLNSRIPRGTPSSLYQFLGAGEPLPPGVRYDRVLLLDALPDFDPAQLNGHLSPSARFEIAQILPRESQFLTPLLTWNEPALAELALKAEESLYEQAADARYQLTARAVTACFEHLHGVLVTFQEGDLPGERHLSAREVSRWFPSEGPSPWLASLENVAGKAKAQTLAQQFRSQLAGRTVSWNTRVLRGNGRPSPPKPGQSL
jgi:putative ATPase